MTGRTEMLVAVMVCVLLLNGCAMRDAEMPPRGSRVGVSLPEVPSSSSTAPVLDTRDRVPARQEPPRGPLEITARDAVMLALENNRGLAVERLNPVIAAGDEAQERAAFDPVLFAEGAADVNRYELRSGGYRTDKATSISAGVSEYLPTGTEVEVDLSTERSWGSATREQHAARAGLTVTQALLQGRGLAPNLASLRQARLDAQISEYELRGYAEALVATVERTYWDYVLANQQVEIFSESLKLAEQQLKETNQRITVGDLAETERAAAQAELALRKEALINARSRVAALGVQLLRMVDPERCRAGEDTITPRTEPFVPEEALDAVEDHVTLAMAMRPDLGHARLLIQRSDLELVKTKNGLLPRMDLFITLGATGYAHSFGHAVGNLPNNGYDVGAGVRFEFPAINRQAKARHYQARVTRGQYRLALRNTEDLVREDVKTAYIEVQRARQQVDATAATRRFSEEKLRAETAKFHVGKSTALLVATAQRDLVSSQVSEVEAVTTYLKALIELYRLDGSLLVRRGIAAPGLTALSDRETIPRDRE